MYASNNPAILCAFEAIATAPSSPALGVVQEQELDLTPQELETLHAAWPNGVSVSKLRAIQQYSQARASDASGENLGPAVPQSTGSASSSSGQDRGNPDMASSTGASSSADGGNPVSQDTSLRMISRDHGASA